MTDRRTICRECGRGRDAPHLDGCETGQAQRAREEFPGLHVMVARLHEREDARA